MRPLPPGVDVFEEPVAVLRLVRQHVGVEGQRGGQQVLRMVADDVVVVLEVGEHLLVAALAVAEAGSGSRPRWGRRPSRAAVALRSSGPRLPLNRLRMILCLGS